MNGELCGHTPGDLVRMYETHFGLRQRPFRPAPDVTRYYPATGHERALAELLQGLDEDEGLVLLTGEPGLGKTLLCHCLLERFHPGRPESEDGSTGRSLIPLEDEVRCAFLTNSHFPDRVALLQAILFDLSRPFVGLTEQELRLTLTEDLLDHAAEKGPTLLILDEAHHLSTDLLEELRLLSNLEGGSGRALQVVLAAQESLLATLARPEMASLRQRLAVRVGVPPLNPEESADYLLHHLRAVSDHPGSILSTEALEVLARGTGGVPRLLNQATHRALGLACAAGAGCVDAEAALEALAILGLSAEEENAGLMNPEDDGEEKDETTAMTRGGLHSGLKEPRRMVSGEAATSGEHRSGVAG
jgi:type II secretory pathway predicted ATPase ExeA